VGQRKGNKEEEEVEKKEEENVEKVWDKGRGIRRRKRWRKCGTKEKE
jgi:hypothetical protein